MSQLASLVGQVANLPLTSLHLRQVGNLPHETETLLWVALAFEARSGMQFAVERRAIPLRMPIWRQRRTLCLPKSEPNCLSNLPKSKCTPRNGEELFYASTRPKETPAGRC